MNCEDNSVLSKGCVTLNQDTMTKSGKVIPLNERRRTLNVLYIDHSGVLEKQEPCSVSTT